MNIFQCIAIWTICSFGVRTGEVSYSTARVIAYTCFYVSNPLTLLVFGIIFTINRNVNISCNWIYYRISHISYKWFENKIAWLWLLASLCATLSCWYSFFCWSVDFLPSLFVSVAAYVYRHVFIVFLNSFFSMLITHCHALGF